MKKNLLFLAAMMVAMCVNAQNVWRASDYYQATQSEALPGMTEITSVEGITFINAHIDWAYKASDGTFTYNGNEYTYAQFQQGDGNGKDGYIAEGSACAIFKPTVNGSLDLAFKFGYNKKFYIAKFTEAQLEEIDLTSADAITEAGCATELWGHYFSNANGVPGVVFGTEPDESINTDEFKATMYAGYTINVEAGNTYYFWTAGSKLMFCGYAFTPAGTDALENPASVVSSRYYLLSGEEVAAPQAGNTGLYIVKNIMSDGSVNVSKVVISK